MKFTATNALCLDKRNYLVEMGALMVNDIRNTFNSWLEWNYILPLSVAIGGLGEEEENKVEKIKIFIRHF